MSADAWLAVLCVVEFACGALAGVTLLVAAQLWEERSGRISDMLGRICGWLCRWI